MPETHIFSGSQYSATPFGGVGVEGKGDTAEITFTDKKRNETKATLQVFKLNKLNKTSDFLNAQEVEENEKYVHTWFIRKSKNQIIKYSGNDQLAFVLTTDANLDDRFSKLCVYEYFHIDYFEELRFAVYLDRKFKLTCDDLREIPGMNDARIKLLQDHRHDLDRFISKGLTLQQIGQVKLDVLKKHLDSAYKLDEALHFVSLQQILGIDHTPLDLNSVEPFESSGERYIGGFGGGSLGDYSYDHSDNEMTYTHKKSKATYHINYGYLNNDLVKSFTQQANKVKPEQFIHAWHTMNMVTSDHIPMTLRFSPDTKQIVKETSDQNFPMDDFKKSYTFLLYSIPYYKEIQFKEFAEKQGYSIEQLQSLNGMTKAKLELMLDFYHDVTDLVEKGVKLADFAKVDVARLKHVLTNFSKARSALEFVDARELLGLNGPSSPNYSPRFYNSPSSSRREVTQDVREEKRSGCTLV